MPSARDLVRRPGRVVRTACPGVAVLLLAACGGGGGGGGPSSVAPPPNAAPIAEAGDAQTVEAGVLVELDASASRDSDGSVSGYSWSQSGGPGVLLQDTDQPGTRFTAPSFTEDTLLTFTVTVTDDDGASASDSVDVTVLGVPGLRQFALSGQILPSASQSLDGDTNDPFNPFFNNDDPLAPQPIANPTTLGGYVNEAGAGAVGRSDLRGDPEDFFRVELLAGQRITLLVAEFQDADADLYLYTPAGELVDFSAGTIQSETIAIAESGTYVVNVSIFSGATNYTLAVGASLAAPASQDIVENQVLLSFEESAQAEELRDDLGRRMRMRQLGGGPRRPRLMALERAAGDTLALRNRLGRQQFRLGQFADPGLAERWSTLMTAKRLAKLPGVSAAEPNYRVRPTATVDDEAYAFQWHYPLINIPGAWDTGVGDAAVIVAVVDTGVLSQHPDLAGQLVPGYDFIRDPREAQDGDGIDPDPEESIGATDPAAINFHGTHVSGTVAARGNNGIGVAGVAFGARVMPLRALNASGGTSYDVNQAIRFAAGLDNDSGTIPAQPADIINLSLAGGGFSASSQRLYDELRARGIAVVAAAGNEGSTLPAYPASYEGVISVSAVDAQQRVTRYSNTGAAIDIAAPGGDGSVDFNGDGYPDGVLSTGASDGEFAYTFLSGTSMATPHVAGVLALMKSVNPALRADDFYRLLREGRLSDDLGAPGRDNLYGHGLINARKALDAALILGGGSVVSDPRLSASSSVLNFGALNTRFEIALSNRGGGELESVEVSADRDWISLEPLSTDEQGLGRYAVRVDRNALAPGIYEGSITATSSANSISIQVIVSVVDARETNLGQLYLIIYDPARDAVVAQTIAEPLAGDTGGIGGIGETGEQTGEGGYRFSVPEVVEGSYQIFAGTDLDNDLLICDAGEACGAYLTIDQPLTIEIDENRDDLNFPVEYLVALPGAAAAGDDGKAPAGENALPTRRRLALPIEKAEQP